MKDSTQIVTAAMPFAANTVNTNTIDLGQQGVRPFTQQFRVRLSNTVATGANSKNINYTLYGSNEANGANAVLQPGTYTVAGNAANHAASNREISLPPYMDKSYIFACALGEANGGNAGDGTFTLEVII